jgi:hypothetical protein
MLFGATRFKAIAYGGWIGANDAGFDAGPLAPAATGILKSARVIKG